MKKTILSLVLCAAVAGTLCGCDNSAESTPDTGISAPIDNIRINPVEESVPEWEYNVQDNGTVEVTAYNGSAAVVKIPEEIDGKPVKSLGYRFSVENSQSTTLEIPACVTYIPSYGMGESLTEYIIGDGSERYYSEDGMIFEVFGSTGTNRLYACPQGRKGEITVPDGVTEIGSYAFNRCAGITSVKLPDSVERIRNGAFGDCTALASVNIPSSVTEIDGYAFRGCTSLETLDIPETVTDFGQYAFSETPFINNIIEKNTFAVINGTLVDGTAAKGETTVPDNVTTIAYNAFKPYDAENTWLAKLTIPDGVTYIGGNAFEDCTALTEVILPSDIKEIGSGWFEGCTGLTSFDIPNGVESLGSYLFRGCTNLTKVTIPDSFVKIDEFHCFEGCDKANITFKGKTYTSADIEELCKAVCANSLAGKPEWEYKETDDGLALTAYNGMETNVRIPSEIDGKPVKAIYYGFKLPEITDAASIEIPASVESISSSSFGKTLTEFIVAEGNERYYSNDGILYERENDRLFCCPAGRSGSVVIPDGTKLIRGFAFYECSGITSVTLPEGVQSIGASAFAGCTELKSVNIPRSVTEIDDNAFNGCTALEALDIPETTTELGDLILAGTPALDKLREKAPFVVINNILIDASTVKGEVTIPNGVVKIAGRAFSAGYGGNPDITGVTIPDSVTEIGGQAFYGCSELTEVKLPKGIKELTTGMFEYCSKLKAIDIPDGVESIGMWAFEGCTNLTAVTVPDSVSYISYECFEGCDKVEVAYKGKTYTAANIEELYGAVDQKTEESQGL